MHYTLIFADFQTQLSHFFIKTIDTNITIIVLAACSEVASIGRDPNLI